MDLGFEESTNPQEFREEVLLQLLAVFVRRFGGEVVITSREFDMVEGLDVIAKQIGLEQLRLRIEDEFVEIVEDED